MRQRTPILLIAVLAGALSASASIPPQRSSSTQPTPQLRTDASLLWQSNHQLFGEPLDAHPFATEFYVHEFASEQASDNRQHSWWTAPMSNAASTLTNAASGLSKKVASLRRVLVRMMP